MSKAPEKPGVRVKSRLLSASEIERTLVRLAHEIVEKSNGSEDLVLVGIKRRGVCLAQRLGKLISTIEKRTVETGTLDIQLYRDDVTAAEGRPVVVPGAIGCEVTGRDVVLCDDVLYTGRTIRASLDALFDHGRPHRVQLAVPLTAAIANYPLRPPMLAARCPPAAVRLSRLSSSRRSTVTSKSCWSRKSSSRIRFARTFPACGNPGLQSPAQ